MFTLLVNFYDTKTVSALDLIWDIENDDLHNRVFKAEKDSYKICEVCGEPGRVRNNGWYMTLCYSHRREGDD